MSFRWQRTPGKPFKSVSGMLLRHKRSWRKVFWTRNTQMGLWRLQLDAIGICQNPLLGSRFLLQLVVLGYHQHGAMSGSQEVHFYFKLHINADICTLPDFFWTTTLPAHQSVRWLTFLITPVVSILSVAELEFSVQYWGHRALYHCDSWQNV